MLILMSKFSSCGECKIIFKLVIFVRYYCINLKWRKSVLELKGIRGLERKLTGK